MRCESHTCKCKVHIQLRLLRPTYLPMRFMTTNQKCACADLHRGAKSEWVKIQSAWKRMGVGKVGSDRAWWSGQEGRLGKRGDSKTTDWMGRLQDKETAVTGQNKDMARRLNTELVDWSRCSSYSESAQRLKRRGCRLDSGLGHWFKVNPRIHLYMCATSSCRHGRLCYHPLLH